ncbi:transcription antitermination factor NusB [Alkaliphilus sp. AH-315-G20]|nr:transcription antitermination factor NusB [Alkaliphilus sp. AH-315-G20]
MSRRLSREFCMKLLFEMDANNEFNLDFAISSIKDEGVKKRQEEYVNSIIHAVVVNITAIDETITKFLKGWKLDRIAKVDLAILRIGFGELMYLDTIDFEISINEAVEMAKKYSASESASFINGVLDKYIVRGEYTNDRKTD